MTIKCSLCTLLNKQSYVKRCLTKMSLLAITTSVAAALVDKSQISCHKISLFATTLQLFKER